MKSQGLVVIVIEYDKSLCLIYYHPLYEVNLNSSSILMLEFELFKLKYFYLSVATFEWR